MNDSRIFTVWIPEAAVEPESPHELRFRFADGDIEDVVNHNGADNGNQNRQHVDLQPAAQVDVHHVKST